jgi:hypothetical protein
MDGQPLRGQPQGDTNRRLGQFTPSEQLGTEITLNWVMGHMGSVGNEEPDRLAKEAAEIGSSDINQLPLRLCNLQPISLSATAAYQHADQQSQGIMK